MIPSDDHVRFNNSATVVAMSGFRLARAHTGKPLILKFEWHYYGWMAEGLIREYRDYVRRHDAPRWTHLPRCLLERGVRAIERGLCSVSFAHTAADIEEALRQDEPAFVRHAAEGRAN